MANAPHAARPDEFSVAGVTLDWVPPNLRVLFAAAGIYVMYLTASVAQEFVINEMQFRQPAILAMSIPLVTVVGSLFLGGFNKRRAPLSKHAAVGALNLLSAQFSNLALLYLSYPAQIVCKSSKVIPVMLVGAILYRKQFPFGRYLAAVCLIGGLGLYAWADSTAGTSSPYGFAIISTALVCDAFLGNLQESLLTEYRATHLEASTYSQAWSLVFSTCLIGVQTIVSWQQSSSMSTVGGRHAEADDTQSAEAARWQPEWDLRRVSLIVGAIVAYAATNWVGYYFILALISLTDSAMTVFVTSTRKAVTIALSFLLFPKAISLSHIAGLGLVSLGVYVQANSKRGCWTSPGGAVAKDDSSAGEAGTPGAAVQSRKGLALRRSNGGSPVPEQEMV